MPLRFLFWLSFTFIALHILFGISTNDVSGVLDPTTDTSINNIMIFNIVNMYEIPWVHIPIPLPTTSFFSDIYSLLTWNYPFFADGSGWNFFRILFLLPISFGTVLLIITQLGPIMISTASMLVSLFVGPIARVLGR